MGLGPELSKHSSLLGTPETQSSEWPVLTAASGLSSDVPTGVGRREEQGHTGSGCRERGSRGAAEARCPGAVAVASCLLSPGVCEAQGPVPGRPCPLRYRRLGGANGLPRRRWEEPVLRDRPTGLDSRLHLYKVVTLGRFSTLSLSFPFGADHKAQVEGIKEHV